MTVQVSSGYPKITQSGTGIVFRIDDGAGNALTPATVGSITVAINGGSPQTLSNPAWSTGISWLLFALPVTVLSTDTVTWSASANWLTTTANGNLGAVTSGSTVNSVGTPLCPTVSGQQTMAIGYNVLGAYYYSPVMLYANAAKQMGGFSNNGVITLDQSGYPQSWTGTTLPTALVTRSSTSPNGYQGCPVSGTWTLEWDGTPGDCDLIAQGNCTVNRLSSSTSGGTTTRTYSVSRTTASGTAPYYAGVSLQVNTGFSGNAAPNVRIYRPGVATDGSQTFDPNVLTMLSGARCIRFMSSEGINNCNLVGAGDFSQGTEISYGSAGRAADRLTQTLTITQVAAEANTDGYFTNVNRTPMLFTCASTGTLVDGMTLSFTSTETVSCGSGANIKSLSGISGAIKIRSSTTFSMTVFVANGTPGPTVDAPTVLSNTSAAMRVVPTLPIADMVALCNAVAAAAGSPCDLWLNVPHALTDSAMTSIATTIANTLAAGSKLQLEYSNEHWNNGFTQLDYCYGQAVLLNASTPAAMTGYNTNKGLHLWYAYRATQHHATARAAFTAAGRSANDVIGVYGSQYTVTGITTNVLAQALYQGVSASDTRVRVAIAPYIDGSQGTRPSFPLNLAGTAADAFGPGACHDCFSQKLNDNSWGSTASSHNTLLLASFPSGQLVCYEGGPQTGINVGSTAALAATTSRAWGRHPQMVPNLRAWLGQIQSSGVTLFNAFTLYQEAETAINSNDTCWGVYQGYAQAAGKGDGSDGKNDNRTNYENMDAVVSTTGEAYNEWLGLLAPAIVNPGTGSSSLAGVRRRAATRTHATGRKLATHRRLR